MNTQLRKWFTCAYQLEVVTCCVISLPVGAELETVVPNLKKAGSERSERATLRKGISRVSSGDFVKVESTAA